MEASTSSLCNSFASSALPPLPQRSLLITSNINPMCQKKGFFRGSEKRLNIKVLASRRDAYGHDFDGKLVDESMIVLRKRIQEMNMLENSYEPPQHWMEWEKQYKRSNNYDLDVVEAVGYLQCKLMETRPGVALAMAALLLLSLPTSMAVVLFHIMALIHN